MNVSHYVTTCFDFRVLSVRKPADSSQGLPVCDQHIDEMHRSLRDTHLGLLPSSSHQSHVAYKKSSF